MSHFQNTHITEAGYFGIPFPQSTPREIKSSFLGVVMRGGRECGMGQRELGLSAPAVCLCICVPCVFAVFSQFPT